MAVGILGLGEVGGAIKELAKHHFLVYGRDLNFDELKDRQVDVLHICIPYSKRFVELVAKVVVEVQPTLVIVDSTVKPGTTRNIYSRTKVLIVHAPIMGVHPYLAKYQKTFTKMIGPVNDKSYRLAREHWLKLEAPAVIKFEGPEETEWGKILDTTYYGWNIIFSKIVKKICRQRSISFDQVYTRFNTIYNEGYAKTLPQVIRPILKFTPGVIGGHCVIPNATMMREEAALFDWLLSFNQELAQEH